MCTHNTEKCTDVPNFARYGMPRQLVDQTFPVVKSVFFSNSVVDGQTAEFISKLIRVYEEIKWGAFFFFPLPRNNGDE